MGKTILLSLHGPLQSYGINSHFDIRNTELYPTKSAIVGMVGAALGYDYEDPRIADLNSLDFAVRIDQAGTITDDYQMARPTPIFRQDDIANKYGKKKKSKSEQQRPKPGIHCTERYYIQDAVFVVAIGTDDEETADEIVWALKHPYYAPFMGRKSCPAPYDMVLGIRDGNPVEVLSSLPWQARKWYQKKTKSRFINLPIYADADLLKKFAEPKRDRVISLSRKGRQYASRLESKKIISVENKDYRESQKLEFDDDIFWQAM